MLRLPIELINLSKLTLRSNYSIRKISTSIKKHPYITTPIFYVNASPHIGHLHSTLLADFYSRYFNLRYNLLDNNNNNNNKNKNKNKTILCTGTDEHGLKIRRVALNLNKTEIELCDEVSKRFKELAKKANINYDIFIRTTEGRHKIAVQHVWRELEKRGHIYKSEYSGWYAVSDEAYYPESQVHEVITSDGSKQMEAIETGTVVEWMEEENYKFRLSSFKTALIDWLSSNPTVLQPPSRSTTLLSALTHPSSSDLLDLSISRPSNRLPWGIRVPGDEDHTVYVWIDALVNYLTAAGYPWKGGEAFKEGEVWPPELMIVGKDIVRFHALYLPAILMALELPLPKNILAHGHWTMNKFKMSKSRGNVADPIGAMKFWGTDAFRCYLIRRGGNCAIDSDYSESEIELFYKKDLLGTLGNSLARSMTSKLLSKLTSLELLSTKPEIIEEEDKEVLKALKELPDLFESQMNEFECRKALGSIFDTLRIANKHLQLLAPWSKTSSPSSIHRALFYASESMRISGILLQTIMPEKSSELLDRLGVRLDKRRWEDLGIGEGGERNPVIVSGPGVPHLFPAVAIPHPGWNYDNPAVPIPIPGWNHVN